MPGPFVIGDDALIGTTGGTRLRNVIIEGATLGPVQYGVYEVTNKILIAGAEDLPTGFHCFDEIYKYYPDFVRAMDINVVPRSDVPLYAWDSVPVWDEEPFTWDEVLGPEPILRTTSRIHQLELEKTCQEIEQLLLLYNINRADKVFLPYLAAQLGMPLPSVSERAQRSFLKNLAKTYRIKGTPASFRQLIESLGFSLTLVERYQRKNDGTIIDGPQIKTVTTNLVLDEPVGTTGPGVGPYDFSLLNFPVQRGSVKIKVYADSTETPIEITDDGAGGWSNDFGGFIAYNTGRCQLTLEEVPGLTGQPINATYRFFVDEFPDPFGQRYTDRWRSSLVSVSLSPKNPSVGLTQEIIDRLFLYFEILKPAHIILRTLDLVLNLSDEVERDDDLNPIAYQFVESVFGNLYIGEAWAAEDNGSLNPNEALDTQHREGEEFLHKVPPIDSSIEPSEPPYVYPWLMNGKFTQPHAGGTGADPGDFYEADWVEDNITFSGVVTDDVTPPTTTNFSIAKGAGTTLGVGDTIVIEPDLTFLLNGGTDPPDGIEIEFEGDIPSFVLPVPTGRRVSLHFTFRGDTYEETAKATGAFTNRHGKIASSSINFTTGAITVTFTEPPQDGSEIVVTSHSVSGEGEQSTITIFTDGGAYYDVTVSPAFPVAPTEGGLMTILSEDSPVFDTLEAGKREEDPLALLFGTPLTPTPNGVNLGAYTGTVPAAILPVPGGTTIIFRYSLETTDIVVDSVDGPFDFASIAAGDDVDLRISIDGAAFVVATMTSGDFADFSAATAAEVRDVVNVVVPGLASVSGAKVRLTYTPTSDTSTVVIGYRDTAANLDANGANADGTDVGSVLGFPPVTGITVYEETVAAPVVPGAATFSNVNGHLDAGRTINTSTGAITITFAGGFPPRDGSILKVWTEFNGSDALGDY